MARQVRQTLPDPPPEYDQQYVAALARSINNYMGQAQALGEVIAARFIMTDPVTVPGDLPNTSSLPVGTIYLKQSPALPPVHVQAANPTPTSSLTFAMMGLAMSFAPRYTTKATITMNGQIGNTGNGETTAQLVYGTGAPPANGAALTGTLLGYPIAYKGPSAGSWTPFAQTVLVTSLILGTTYWVDIAVRVTAAASILNEVEVIGQGLRDVDEYFLTVVTKQDP